MDPDGVRRVAAALAVSACRRLTMLAWPIIAIVDLVAPGHLPGVVYGATLAMTCVALADWIRRGLLAAQAAADADRDKILARVHDRINEESARARDDLDRSVAWLLRRMERGS